MSCPYYTPMGSTEYERKKAKREKRDRGWAVVVGEVGQFAVIVVVKWEERRHVFFDGGVNGT